MMRVSRIYAYENIVQVPKYSHERMVLSTKSKGWGASLISILLTLLLQW